MGIRMRKSREIVLGKYKEAWLCPEIVDIHRRKHDIRNRKSNRAMNMQVQEDLTPHIDFCVVDFVLVRSHLQPGCSLLQSQACLHPQSPSNICDFVNLANGSRMWW